MNRNELDLSKTDILPSSRALVARRHVPIKGIEGVTHLVPLYCASCGVEAGMALEVESATFEFVMCDPCGEKYGHLIANMLSPQEAFFTAAVQEQMEKHGRVLDNEEILEVVASDTSPLATLIKKGR